MSFGGLGSGMSKYRQPMPMRRPSKSPRLIFPMIFPFIILIWSRLFHLHEGGTGALRLLHYVPAQEVPNQMGHLVTILLQREMSGIEQMELQVLQVSFVRFRAVSGKDGIILSPDDERRRLILAEVGLPR